MPSSLPYLRNALTIVAGIAAVSYALGCLIVNRYLAQFGYSSFALLRSSYIGAGLWAVLPFLFGAIVFTASSRLVGETSKGAPDRFRVRAWRGTVRSLLYALGGFLASIPMVSMQIFSGLSGDNLIRGTMATIVAVVVVFECVRAFRLPDDAIHVASNRARFVVSVVFLPAALWAFLNYASAAYSQVPFGLGGGRPRPAMLLVDSTRVSRRELAAVALMPDSSWRLRAALLTRTDAAWVIVAPGARKSAIEIPAAAVRLAVFSRRQLGNAKSDAIAEWIDSFGADYSNTDSILTTK